MALCLDLTLRTEGRTSLDEVMRALWDRSGGGTITEADVLSVLHERAGRSLAREFEQWVHGTHELPLADLLPRLGWTCTTTPRSGSIGWACAVRMPMARCR